ncbi:ABC transporter permease [Mesomycoplasma ovipneumoniae]|uniref:ABC transporter permease n=1 Tax=Mesomycoplasma ovipneumoniae TaxID=29562 RepID=UPI002964A486|nr:ABC transporter permease [Mesomycoplasma ovipneumoniae]MDW2908941.1 ABC transporter permease [Mesomycoplasma ovipneumoniae]MDW2911987.1 ABC transporter permease [Mesomycoplasma ovipneumoniae]MDW2918231.1 ABC transporter permease [Mesomycoplasma ovipneumoniae]MDW2919725.1 ABC transporter permease [Mesomycoplasma ovipneumoniae]MDW2925314.1 ABC transporter permease [Mesomycoplasma ovipneumoniae]
MIKKKINFSIFSNFFFKKLEKNSSKSLSEKILSTFWAIFFGILVSFIFIWSFGYNPLKVYYTIVFKIAFAWNEVRNLLLITSIFIFASIAIAIPFKSGLFNIGLPAQMMISGIVSLMIVLNLTSINIYARLLIAALLGILTSGILGALVGILKSYLKINEVISTILLNWIIFYIGKFFLTSTSLDIGFKTTTLTSQTINETAFLTSIFLTRNFSIIMLFLSLLFAFLIWFVLQKTSIGLSIKITGQNKDAANYAGINNKKTTIVVMTFSGIVGGIAGFAWYVFYRRSFTIQAGMPREGFDAILLALLAFNSPFGIIPISFFYSVLLIGTNALEAHSIALNQQTTQIIIGIIVYLSAISVIFIHFKPLKWMMNVWRLSRTGRFFSAKNAKNINIKPTTPVHSNLSLLFIKPEKKEKIRNLQTEITNFENIKAELLTLFLDQKVNIFWIYRKIQKINIKLFLLKRAYLKIKNYDNTAIWKQKKKELKNKSGLDSALKSKNVEEKLAFFEQINQKRRKLNIELNELGYFDAKNNFNAFWQQIIEHHLQFRSLKSEIIQNFKADQKAKKPLKTEEK